MPVCGLAVLVGQSGVNDRHRLELPDWNRIALRDRVFPVIGATCADHDDFRLGGIDDIPRRDLDPDVSQGGCLVSAGCVNKPAQIGRIRQVDDRFPGAGRRRLCGGSGRGRCGHVRRGLSHGRRCPQQRDLNVHVNRDRSGGGGTSRRGHHRGDGVGRGSGVGRRHGVGRGHRWR